MKKWKIVLNNILVVVLFVSAAVGLCLLLRLGMPDSTGIAPTMLMLAVFLIAMYSTGYLTGIISAVIVLFINNYIFVEPYYNFDFLKFENLVYAAVLLILSILTSLIVTRIKQQNKMKYENEIERTRAQLMRSLSHDLRTPLTTIYGSCSVIIDNYDAIDKQRQLSLLSDVRRDAEMLTRMVENLLTVTRINNKNVKVEKNPVVVEELADIALMKFHKYFPTQEVQLFLPEEFVMVPMDSMLISQVLVNLLENAVMHATGMTELTLSIRIDGSDAVFEVIDNGAGIDDAKAGKLFVNYFDKIGTPTVDGKKGSMGIGLTVCATIIEAHSGKVTVRNRPEGGAIFSFTLPLEEEQENAEQV